MYAILFILVIFTSLVTSLGANPEKADPNQAKKSHSSSHGSHGSHSSHGESQNSNGDQKNRATIVTEFGEITFEFYEDDAPLTVRQFKAAIDDGMGFFR